MWNKPRTFKHLTPSAPYASCACFTIVQTISSSTPSKKLCQLTQNLPPLGPFVAGSWTSWTPARIEMRTTGKGRLCRNGGEDLREDLDVCWMRRGVFWGQNGKKWEDINMDTLWRGEDKTQLGGKEDFQKEPSHQSTNTKLSINLSRSKTSLFCQFSLFSWRRIRVVVVPVS